MTAVAPERTMAEWRPALVLYASRLALGFIVAYPAARAFAAFGASPFADGDRVLFEPGGFYLVEVLRVGARAFSSVLQAAGIGALVLSLVGLFPLAAALVGVGAPRASVARWFADAVPKLPAFVLLWGATWLARVVYAGAAALVLSGATSATKNMVDERTADLIVVVCAAILACGLFVIDVGHDLARASVVENHESPWAAATGALRTLVLQPSRTAVAAGVPASLAIALVASGAYATGVADVARPGGGHVAAVFLVHQLVVFAIAFLRMRWLEGARRLVATGTSSTAGASSAGESGLLVDLHVAPSGSVPGEIEPHDPPPE